MYSNNELNEVLSLIPLDSIIPVAGNPKFEGYEGILKHLKKNRYITTDETEEFGIVGVKLTATGIRIKKNGGF